MKECDVRTHPRADRQGSCLVRFFTAFLSMLFRWLPGWDPRCSDGHPDSTPRGWKEKETVSGELVWLSTEKMLESAQIPLFSFHYQKQNPMATSCQR